MFYVFLGFWYIKWVCRYVKERTPATSQLCSIMETAGKPCQHCDDPDTEERMNQNGDGKIDWKGHCTIWTFSYVHRFLTGVWQICKSVVNCYETLMFFNWISKTKDPSLKIKVSSLPAMFSLPSLPSTLSQPSCSWRKHFCKRQRSENWK